MGKGLDEFQTAHAPTKQEQFLRAEGTRLTMENKALRKQVGEALEVRAALANAIAAAKPVKLEYKPKPNQRNPLTMVLHLTDLHIGEVIEENEVDGFNKYNPDIAIERLDTLADKVLHRVQTQRAGFNVPNLRIFGTADFISGDIHEELKVTNAYPAPRQAVEAGHILTGLIQKLAPHFEEIEADMITLDNHGRMTSRNQFSQGGENNWSYVVAHIVKDALARQKNVKVNVHAKASALVPVGPERYLLFHGHQIKGWAGIPYYGFDRRVAMEAVKRMNVSDTSFTKLVLGHFHVSVDAPNWIIGGSLSGTNAFDHGCGRHMSAHQTSWFVHPEHGQFDFTRWWLR